MSDVFRAIASLPFAFASPGPSRTSADAKTRDERVRAAVAEHYEVVWRSLRRFGVVESNADDAAQHVFCTFARRIDEVVAGKEKTFLVGVALRVAQNARREHARRPELAPDEVLDAAPCSRAMPDELVDAARARALLDTMLDRLPVDLRAVFVLHEIEEMTMAEIAAVLDVPSGTVASRLRRARAAFDELARDVRNGGAR